MHPVALVEIEKTADGYTRILDTASIGSNTNKAHLIMPDGTYFIPAGRASFIPKHLKNESETGVSHSKRCRELERVDSRQRLECETPVSLSFFLNR